jgi:WD40 repeat protein
MLKVHSLDSVREISSLNGGHIGQISCLTQGNNHQLIVTGGVDCTCRVWVLENSAMALSLSDGTRGPSVLSGCEDEYDDSLVSIHILWGHSSPITAVYYSDHHDLIVSGSQNGMLCMHSARKGRFIRSIKALEGKKIDLICIAMAGYIIVYSNDTNTMTVFWINGELLKESVLSLR